MIPVFNRAQTFLLIFILHMVPVASFAENLPSDLIRQQFSGDIADREMLVRGHRVFAKDMIARFYQNRQFEPAWTNPAQVEEVIRLVDDAWTYGLLPEDYFAHTLRPLLALSVEHEDAQLSADLDILLTESLVRYASNRRYGKVDAASLDRNINFKRVLAFDAPTEETLQRLLNEGAIESTINQHSPQGRWYSTLRNKLLALTAVADQGGWQQIPDGPTLHPGDNDGRIIPVRTRLGIPGGSQTFDDDLKAEVIEFQHNHRLDADGVIGPATLRTMNMTVNDQIDRIRASLERLRWVTASAGDVTDFVAVNIAGFQLYLVRDQEIEWTTPVMVGKSYRQTPVFRGDIQYLELNPTWTVPPGIHRKDILPAVKRNPEYLQEKHMIVLDYEGNEVESHSIDWNSYKRAAPYIFRQTPGPWNALGEVKFIFPNKHFVFLHDTNHRDLFVHPSRAFSSGCIRVYKPLELAERLLVETRWDRGEIDTILASKQTRRINLDDPMPVFVLYLTAAIDEDGEVIFLDDIYERDGRLNAALDMPYSFITPDKAVQ